MSKELKALDYLYNSKMFKYNGDETHFREQYDLVKSALQRLEDLEEELGCPLDVLIKALNGVIYYMDDDCLEYEVNPYLVKEDNGLAFDITDYGSWLYLSDYKNTWWLKEDKSE